MDAPENHSCRIEKTGIFLRAVLQGIAPISWRIRGISPEHTNRQVLALQFTPLGNPRWYDGSDAPTRRQQANRRLLSLEIRDVSGRIPMSVSWLGPKAPRRNSGGLVVCCGREEGESRTPKLHLDRLLLFETRRGYHGFMVRQWEKVIE